MHFIYKLGFQALRLGGLIFLVAITTASKSQAANNVGWVLADQPPALGQGFIADSAHSFNSAKGSVSVGNFGNGLYQIRFASLAISSSTPANVQVTAYNSPNQCLTKYPEVSGTTAVATIECFNAAGTPTSTPFTLLYQTRNTTFGSANAGLAFLTQESNTHTAAPYGTYNSTGAGASVVAKAPTGHGDGSYVITFDGLKQLGGNAQVNGYLYEGEHSGTDQCKVVSWTSGSNIIVQCYRVDNGNPNDSAFSLIYAIGAPYGFVPAQGTLGAWLFANASTSTTPYNPVARYQYNGFRTGAMTAQKTSTGHYTVTIPGRLSYTSAIALVTATGAGNAYCNVAGWIRGTIDVVCYDHTQSFADSRFNLTFQTAP